jgi:hypothetical protein
MKIVKIGKSYIRPSIIAAAIIAVVFSHFAVSQFIFFESEKDSVISEAISKQPFENRTEFEAKKTDVVIAPKTIAPASPISEPETRRPALRQTAVESTVIKKKEAPRDSRTERLRRAEKLLTGV